jgi:small-conductance mechanosensitive channel
MHGISRDMLHTAMKFYFALLLALLLLSAPSASFSAEGTDQPAADAAPIKSGTWRNFENLFNTINEAEKNLDSLRQQLREAKSDAERERIRSDMDLLDANIDSLRLAWEMWATGGVDLQMFSPQKEEKFDWRQEMQSAFEPIVMELRRLTERPRKMERLRSEQSFYQQRLAAADAALQNIVEYKNSAPSPDLVKAFGGLESRWRKRQDEIKNQLALINLQLEELQAPNRPTEERATEALKALLSERFVNLLLALLAAGLTYSVLQMINRLYMRMMMHRGRRRPFLARVAHLSFMLISVVLALLAGMAVLYVRGDWILLGLLLIVLMGAALTLQRTLPAFIKEAKVLLNLGPVREGERVIYNGLPWKVQSLNMYSNLVNPVLRGGSVMLPAGELISLISRRYDDGEPWFPTRENDFVVLGDGSYGRIVLQTPEVVQMRVAGALRSYPVGAFLGSNPQNLSLGGFAVAVKFGIDYQHQSAVTAEIRAKFEDYLGTRLRQSAFGGLLTDFFVEFDEAAASSLNLFIWAAFTGDAAESYFRIRRLVQRLAVDACNANGWVIPFNQMTVHLAAGSESFASPAATP